ncbi:MAG: HAD family hydrolase [Candidatus Bathyarchaeota archaeon]|nr:HAD family hydrolase [Candidatus Bathyarchaeota archaeon]
MSDKINAKGIFLDLDGTIVDSSQAYLQAAQTAFLAIKKTPPTLTEALEIPKRLEQGLDISHLVNGETNKFLNIYLKTYYTATKTKTRLLPEITFTLKMLSKKAKLALITMRHVPKQDLILELQHFGLSKYFSQVITAADTVKPKPSPEALNKCIKDLNLQISDCLIAGDSVNDIRAGKAAGAKTVAVLSGLYLCEELEVEKPDLILPDLNVLPEYLH